MGSTKIINVLRNDRFEDVFDAFKKSEAEEVIFIFPKNSLLSKKEEHFALLASEATETQRQITIMTADQNIADYARKYGFRFLAQPVKSKKMPSQAKNEEEERPVDSATVWLEENDDNTTTLTDLTSSPQVELTMARSKKTSKTTAFDKKLDKLESIWLKSGAVKKIRSAKNFWSGFSLDLIKKGQGHQKLNLILISSAIIVLLLSIFTFLGNAKVIIKPQKQPLNFDLLVSVSTSVTKIDANLKQIPGQFLAFRSNVAKDFSVTGEKEIVRKAKGEITVFNNFNSEPQGLRATTRFASSKGLIFRIPRPIVIPGAKLINGKLTPGTITVEVIADKAGPEYNINADRFTIPGFAGTLKFDGFYASSNKPMAGGVVGLSKVITETDFNSAKETVIQEAKNQSLENLKTKNTNFEMVEPITNEVVSLKATAEVDDTAESFAIAATTEAKTISFSKEDLLKLIEIFINKNGNLVLLKDGLQIDYKNPQFDFEKKTMVFTASVKGKAAAKIEEEKIINGLLGLKQNKIEDYLLSFKEVESARVILSPFWARSIPKNIEKVQIKIIY